MVQINEGDSVKFIADKIFKMFEVGDHCEIFGFELTENSVVPKGALVLQEIKRLDESKHVGYRGDKKARKMIYPTKDFIGGPIAQKIFKFEVTYPEQQEPRYRIWRSQ